jgi:hypothetical protein
MQYLAMILAITVLFAVLMGSAGYLGALNGLDNGFAQAVTETSQRQRRFLTVWGIHIGAYAGGAIGLIIAAIRIFRRRPAA